MNVGVAVATVPDGPIRVGASGGTVIAAVTVTGTAVETAVAPAAL